MYHDILDILISNHQGISIKRLNSIYSVFHKYVNATSVNYNELTRNDKLNIYILLVKVNNPIKYDYKTFKLNTYLFVYYTYYKTEHMYLDLDVEYINLIINTILKTNIQRLLNTL